MSKKILLLMLVLVVALTGVIGCSKNEEANAKEVDPVTHIMSSMWNTESNSNVNADVELKVQLDEKLAVEKKVFDGKTSDPAAMAKYVNKLLDKLSIVYKINAITDDSESLFKADAGVGLYYNDKVVVDGKIYAKPWEFGFEVPQLTNKALYIDLEQILEQEGIEFPFKDINIKDYIEVLCKKDDAYNKVAKNSEAYKKVIADYLEGKVEKLDGSSIKVNVYGKEKKVDVAKYKINFKLSDLQGIYVKLFEIAKTDDAVKELILARINDLEKLMLENKDYEKFEVTEIEFKEGIQEIKDGIKNDWEEGFQGFIEGFKKGFSKSTMSDSNKIDDILGSFIVSIDNDNMMRQVEYDFQAEFVKIKEIVTINAVGDDVKVDIKEDPKDRINIYDLENNEALTQELLSEVVKNLGDVLGGEAVEEIVKDIKEESKVLPEEESKNIINSVDMYFAQLKAMLPFMLQGMGME